MSGLGFFTATATATSTLKVRGIPALTSWVAGLDLDVTIAVLGALIKKTTTGIYEESDQD